MVRIKYFDREVFSKRDPPLVVTGWTVLLSTVSFRYVYHEIFPNLTYKPTKDTAILYSVLNALLFQRTLKTQQDKATMFLKILF